jgi:hypothetical protein
VRTHRVVSAEDEVVGRDVAWMIPFSWMATRPWRTWRDVAISRREKRRPSEGSARSSAVMNSRPCEGAVGAERNRGGTDVRCLIGRDR